MSDIAEWYSGIPVVTRWWFTYTIVISLLGRFGIVSPQQLVLLPLPIFKKFQLWRPFTAAFYYPVGPSTGLHFLLKLFFIYHFSSRLESGAYEGKTADYFIMLLFMWLCCVCACLVAEFLIVVDPLILSMLYVWCQLNKDVIVTYLFGIQFPAAYFPWILLAINTITSGRAFAESIGILVGHTYYFLKFVAPDRLGAPSILQAPTFLHRWFSNSGARRNSSAHYWGSGRVLGR